MKADSSSYENVFVNEGERVFKIGRIWQADEFVATNTPEAVARFANSFGEIPLTREAHLDFKKRVPHAIGLIRTGDPTPYGNLILESA